MVKITRTVTRHYVDVESGENWVHIGEFAKMPSLTEIKKIYKQNSGSDWDVACRISDDVREMKYTMDLETFIANAEEVE